MENQIKNLPLSKIKMGDNDRLHYDKAELYRLADSIKEHGLRQPIGVRQIGIGLYEIIYGHRRYLAHELAGLDTIRAEIITADDDTSDDLMWLENHSRVDLDPISEARAFQKRIDRHGWSIAETARRCYVSADKVASRLKLLTLSEKVQHLLMHGHMPLGYADAMIGLDTNRQQIILNWLAGLQDESPSVRQVRVACDTLRAAQDAETTTGLPMFDEDFSAHMAGLFAFGQQDATGPDRQQEKADKAVKVQFVMEALAAYQAELLRQAGLDPADLAVVDQADAVPQTEPVPAARPADPLSVKDESLLLLEFLMYFDDHDLSKDERLAMQIAKRSLARQVPMLNNSPESADEFHHAVLQAYAILQ